MLSQQYEDSDVYQAPVSTRGSNYKTTDIFHLAPDSTQTGKRRVVDRNQSSVFGGSIQAPTQVKKDRMASDIFFGGNVDANARFGGYESSIGGSSRRSSAKELYQQKETRPAPVERQPEYDAPVDQGIQRISNFIEDYTRDANYDYQPNEAQQQYHENKQQSSNSNVFESSEQEYALRGARRHYQQRQQSSDIFFQQDAPPAGRRQSYTSTYQEPQWVPSIKVATKPSSFSNIFGDGVEGSQTSLRQERGEKAVHVSGLSSDTLNRDRRGKGGRRAGPAGSGSTTSQIWF